MEPSSLPHYDLHAEAYAEALLSHDLGEAREKFLAVLPRRPADILDLGCGPGRDLAAFAEAGERAVGLDGCSVLADVARRHSGCPVWEADLRTAPLPPAAFDGLFAQAVLFHIATAELPELLQRLRRCLRPDGVLYACDPSGAGEEGWADGRYLAFRRPQSLAALYRRAGFDLVEQWRRPPGRPRRQQDWQAWLWRRRG